MRVPAPGCTKELYIMVNISDEHYTTQKAPDEENTVWDMDFWVKAENSPTASGVSEPRVSWEGLLWRWVLCGVPWGPSLPCGNPRDGRSLPFPVSALR